MSKYNEKNSRDKLVDLAFGKDLSKKEALKDLQPKNKDDLYKFSSFINDNQDILKTLAHPVEKREAEEILKRVLNKSETPKMTPSPSLLKSFWSKLLSFNKIYAYSFASILFILSLSIYINSNRVSNGILSNKSPVELISQALGKARSPEFPLFLQKQGSFQSFPVAEEQYSFSLMDKLNPNSKLLVNYRPSLLYDPYQKESKTLISTAIGILEKENIDNPGNVETYNLLGICYYYLADLEIRTYLRKKTWNNKEEAFEYMKKSIQYFDAAYKKEPKIEAGINLASAKIAMIHLEKKASREYALAILSLLLQNPEGLTSYLFDSSSLPHSLVFPEEKTLQTAFLAAYFLVLNYSYLDEMAGQDLPDLIRKEKQKVKKALSLILHSSPGKSTDYWYTELLSMEKSF
ncbi:MAG: hypothetical protein H7A25_03345 [Leptospiraceae bacterium]|nr:hypothetical protein [Leptospiraceae bacterium]MCP5498911.1 hypothetical protein [Leptospiraceae bacterium]